MPTSELSDALNPYYAQPRSRQAAPVAHRNELEVAIPEPARPPTAHSPARAINPHGGGVHAVQELLRFLSSTREAQEIERRRRIAWEQEQEAKYRLRQAEMERRMLEMQQEITALKARLAFGSPASVSANTSTLEYVSSTQQPTPSTSPTLSHPSTPATFSMGQPVAGPSVAKYLASPLLPPTRFVAVNPTCKDGSESEEEEDSDDESTAARFRTRRKNHHDRRCLTIQHAMRNHILRVMMLETDKELPDSHVEGTPLGAEDAVRFVWDKTPRQSVHNGRMKERVLRDLKANRKMYRHVPDKDFGKKTLDSVFDQAFVTLRQKFRAQRDETAARAQRQREEVKAQRARRLSRRKVKLANRSEARNKMGVFEHATFDGALQVECMSSEESEVEEETGSTVFRIRGFSWRSVRLQRFYEALDAEEPGRARRGVGRRVRVRGEDKEADLPRGVSRWMVSKGWSGDAADVAPDGMAVTMDMLGEESA